MKELITQFYPYAKKELGFDPDVRVILKKDLDNAKDPLGMTGHYEPSSHTVVLYTANRHPKDVLRSFAHELTHHAQNCRGEFEGGIAGEQGYAQNNPHLRSMELEAYRGSILVRDWEDNIKGGITQMSQQITVTEEQLRKAIRETLYKFVGKKSKTIVKEQIAPEARKIVPEPDESEKSDQRWYHENLQHFLIDKFIKK